MTKRKSVLLMLLSVLMIVSMAAFMVSCGGEDPTLESYIAEDEEAKAEIEDMAETNGLDISVVENELTYTYKYDETFDADMVDMLSEQLESAMASMDSTFNGLVTDLEEQSGISGITLVVVYQNGDGSELYRQTYPVE